MNTLKKLILMEISERMKLWQEHFKKVNIINDSKSF